MTQQEENCLLDINNLVVQYVTKEETVHAVNGVSFQLHKGETLGLVGETGAGKTTIARSIMSILPVPPAKVIDGQILYKGQNVINMPEKQLRRIRGKEISMIFQDPMTALNPMFSIGKQIAEVFKIHEFCSGKEARKRAEDMLELVGISRERYDEYPHQFSGGMKQRVSIAIALACNPRLLIADEPTTALDVTIQSQVLEMMLDLRKKFGTSMILITHDLGVVASMCDRVAIVYAGEIVEIGSAEEIFDHCRHPYTVGLFEALPSIKKKVRRLAPIEGAISDPTNLPQGCKFNPRCKYCTEKCLNGNMPLTEIAPGHYTRCTVAKRGDL